MSVDLELDDAQRAVRDEIARFCAEHGVSAEQEIAHGRFPSAAWRALGELGFFALATPDGAGGAAELVAACEALGAAAFPGPLCESLLAAQLLPEGDPARAAVLRGEAIVGFGVPPRLPWAREATLLLALDGSEIRRATPRGPIEPLASLGGEPWGRVELAQGDALPGAARALALHATALAAWLAAAGTALVLRTAEHARTRRQFGRAIGQFQAVSHPLADRFVRCEAAGALARAAACAFDEAAGAFDDASPELAARAAVARLSARAAALDAAHTAHQLFGAQGIALEGPVFRVSRRIRQLASQPPEDAPARAAALVPYGL